VSVTIAKGFVAAGVRAGLKKSGNLDLALVHNLGPLKAAATVFTTNRCQANPVIWSKQVMADGEVSAIVLNSGGATATPAPKDSKPRMRRLKKSPSDWVFPRVMFSFVQRA